LSVSVSVSMRLRRSPHTAGGRETGRWATLTRLARLATLVGLFAGASGCLSFHQGPMPGEPKNATYARLGDTRVRYVDSGKGSPVVLLHGFASALETWTAVMPTLAKTHRVVALDLKGFGWTDRPEGDYSPAAQAELVFALLDKLGIGKASLVAHSWGSSVALAMALRSPARVERLALYDAWVYEEQLPTPFIWARADGMGELIFGLFYQERPDEKMALAFYDPKRLDERFVQEVEAALDRPGTTAAALAAVRGQRFEEVEERYRSIQQPVLLLWGREDRVTPLSYGERLASELPNAQLVSYPRCGHFPMIEASEPSTRELVSFLDAHRGPSAPAARAPASASAADAADAPAAAASPKPTAATEGAATP
jgi:pimeloyl-ACP methyl ester carboxylesterase